MPPDLDAADTVLDRLDREIRHRPGRTAAELAEALFGGGASPSRLQFAISVLDIRGRIQRRGQGGRSDPFRYFRATTPS